MKLKIGVLVLFLAALSVLTLACGGAATPTPATTPVALAPAAITAKGEIVPEHSTKVAFPIGGTVSQIPVKEGDQVKKGNTLALLDTSDLQLQVQNAEDSLALAQASLAQANTPASAEEIAAAEASYQSALAGLERAKKKPTEQDITAAESALASAKSAYSSAVSAYNKAKNGPTQEDMQVLQSTLAKAKAALDMAQSAYDRIGGASNPFSAQTPQALQLQQATQDYQIALANYNKAVKPDASAIASANAGVAQAQSQIDAAQQALQKLQDSPNQEDIDQAQAQVDSAKAQLDLKKKGARPEDLAVAQASVDQAQTGVDQAKAALAKATLVATMDGTITDIAIREGELASAGQPLFTIADLTNLQVETTDLDEFGAAKVKVGAPATIRVNAFTDKNLTGKVSDIADESVLLASGDVSYPVTIILDSQDPDLRWGMTVKVEFPQQVVSHAYCETHDLVKTYKMGDTTVRALDGLDMSIDAGEFMAIMGRSGSGKSTLLNMLGCLDRPTSGEVIIDGTDVAKARKSDLPKIRREKIGFVFQHFNLLPTLTALENVMLPLKYAGIGGGERKRRAQEALKQVGMDHRENHRPAEMSGGEQQRASVARAIVTKPAIVLGDELTGELDSKTSRAVIELLRDFNRTTKQTFVLVTHDPAVAEQTDRVVHLMDGKVEFEEKHAR